MTGAQRERIEELTLRMLDDDLDEAQLRELEDLLDDEDAARLHRLLLEQEAALRGGRTELDMAERTLAEIAASQRVEMRVMDAIRVASASWWTRSYTWAAAAAFMLVAALGGGAWWVQGWEAPPQEALLFGSNTFEPGTTARVHVLVRNARTLAPYADAAVRLTLASGAGAELWTTDATTDEQGVVAFSHALPHDVEEGDYALRVVADADGYTHRVTRTVAVRRHHRIYVTTDKPRYQPGQIMHLRALALSSSGLVPAADQGLTFSVHDAKGNLVSKQQLETSKHGLAFTDFELADQVNTGRYRIRATVGSTVSERTVLVERYVLPKLTVDVQTSAPHLSPGGRVEGTVKAKYVFGEPVEDARVTVTLKDALSDVAMGEARVTKREAGTWSFSASIPARFGQLEPGTLALAASVVDRAGFENTKTIERRVTADPFTVDLAVPGGTAVYATPNRVYLAVRTPDGRPAQVSGALDGKAFTTDASGLAEVTLLPPTNATVLVELEGMRQLLPFNSAQGILIDSDKAIYEGGASIRLTVYASWPQGTAFVDAVQGGHTLFAQAVSLADQGTEIVYDVPADVHGPIRLRAFAVNRWGKLKRSERVVIVQAREALSIAATLDRDQYRPGERAKLAIAVTRDGAPAPAALSLAGVDEAVFAMSEMRPGMEQAYFELDRERLAPEPSVFPIDGVLGLPRDLRDRAAKAALAELSTRDDALGPGGDDSYEQRVMRTGAERDRWLGWLGAVAFSLPLLGCLVLLVVIMAQLWRATRSRSAPVAALAPAMRRVTWAWVGAIAAPVLAALAGGAIAGENAAMIGAALGAAVAVVILRLASVRVHAISDALRLDILLFAMGAGVLGVIGLGVAVAEDFAEEGWLVIAVLITYVAWAIVAGLLAAAGRHLAFGATRRQVAWLVASRAMLTMSVAVGFVFVTLTATMRAGMTPEPQAVAAAFAPTDATTPLDKSKGEKPQTGEPARADGPRVRSHFPETLLWRPQLITDELGKVELDIPLADSITTWRLSMAAVSTAGELGAAEEELRVFQPFFIEPNLPVALTQNDVIAVPVAVFNYLDTAQEVEVKLERAAWLGIDGRAVRRVRLAPREVARVSFTVTAKAAGEHRLVLHASAGEVADAVERVVTVTPDGERIDAVTSGELTDEATLTVTIPDAAIPGSEDLALKIYPGAFSQVAEGMEGVFRMPYGCFEQTSSVTYPSLLVMDYMRSNDAMRPELQAKAERLIQIGYQRLLSFEVAGGGFEWFGKSPAHPVLTAYGLMEFSDMRRVQAVDEDMIARTQGWLLSQQRADGSWTMASVGIAEGATNAYAGQDLRTTAYIAWALAESGVKDPRLARALAYLDGKSGSATDSYTLALIANALIAGSHASAGRVVARLAPMAVSPEGDAHWDSAVTGVTHGRGNALAVEATGLAARALLRAKRDVALAHRALGWLVKQRDPQGTWQSTQATVAAMRALLAAPGATTIEKPLDVTVVADGETLETIHITPETSDVYHLVSLRRAVRKGTRRVVLRSTGGGTIAYQLVTTHFRPHRAATAEQPLSLELAYDADTVRIGGTLRARAKLTNHRDVPMDMALVELRVVPGFALDNASVDALVRGGVIARYDRRGPVVSLYVRRLAAGQTLELPYRMVAEVTASVSAPGARAYLYYEPDVSDVARPVPIVVTE